MSSKKFVPFTAEQKRQYAIKMSKMRQQQAVTGKGGYRPAVKGRGGYRPRTVRGRGSYSSKGSIGEEIGQQLGKFLGGKAESLIKSLVGFGDYRLSEDNTLLRGGMDPPQIINSIDQGGFIIRHREYLGDILASQNFEVNSFDINPGLPSTFPWLSQVAAAFDEYQMRGMCFEFKSTSSDAVLSTATNSSLGSVTMATQYNPTLPIFPDKITMANYEYANSNKPSVSFFHPVETKGSWTPGGGLLFTRTGPIPTGQDQRWYDLGRFQIATEGMQADGGVCGELWITFEIVLRKPKLNEQGLASTDHFQLGTVTNANPLGTTSVLVPGSTLNGTIDNGDAYNFNPSVVSGNYLFVRSCKGGATALTVQPPVPTNCTVESYWLSDSVSVQNSTGTSAYALQVFVVNVVTNSVIPGTTGILFGSGGDVLPTSVTGGDLWVTRLVPSVQS